MINIQVSFSPLLKSEKVYSRCYLIRRLLLLTVINSCHEFQMMLYPHFVCLVPWSFAKFSKTQHWSF